MTDVAAANTLKQKAVLWMASPTLVTNESERKVNSANVEIDVRWENTQSESTTPTGEAVATAATVFVDRDIIEGSILWLGKKKDLPDTLSNLKKVVSFNKIPDVKGRRYTRVCAVVRYSDTLPETF